MFDLSIGIMAYNEEAGMARLLDALLRQELVHARLKEIFVVASGCTDRTEAIVRDFMKDDPRIHLITQDRRRGKASAINLFLSSASGDICVLESADTVPEQGALDKLVAPFEILSVGMTGARPVPVNSAGNFIGYAVNLMWSLHHRISLVTPKLGELVAFRNFIRNIPEDTAVDEASIEAMVTKADYELRYVPEAVVRNKGPENVREFIRQRRRIAAGHEHLLREQKYKVSTSNPKKILKILIQEQSWNLRDTIWTMGAVLLEATARALGGFDFHIRKKVPFIWDISSSTKRWD
ncbi:MAG: glycosyltransferase [Thermodesulfobacteriota bacterium]|nr:glycosyltransferase [Thermodesulfobacteriota bacterium]